jgi:DNA polymerase V
MIGLMDCNNFFVSCERLFRPDLIKKPVAVLSSNDGCIVSRSQEVKDLGIPMGAPHFQVADMCKKHNVTLFSSNFTLYRDISRRVMHALSEEFSKIEVYSVDEAFFEVERAVSYNDIVTIRARIIQKTGIPVSFGIATTKTIAKAASVAAKKGSGVMFYDMATWNAVVGTISCGSIWGIGRETSQKLTRAGIRTVKDLLTHDRQYYRNAFGVVGERIYAELQGTPVYRIGETIFAEHQSITSTRSFAKPVYDRAVLESALGYHITQVALKLRARGHVASKITVMAAPSRHGEYALRSRAVTCSLEVPTNDTLALIKQMKRELQQIFDPAVPYKKAGVIVSGIMPESQVSGTLFPSTQDTKNVYDIVDRINERFGRETLTSGIIHSTGLWQEKKRLKSCEYTTRWGEIPRIKAL